MSNSEPMSEEEQIELETVQLQEAIELGQALERLEQNPDFKRVILEGYLEKKVLDSASLLAVPQMRNDRAAIMEDLICSSNLQFFFRWIHNQHQAALNPVLSDAEEEEMAAREAAEAADQLGGVN